MNVFSDLLCVGKEDNLRQFVQWQYCTGHVQVGETALIFIEQDVHTIRGFSQHTPSPAPDTLQIT